MKSTGPKTVTGLFATLLALGVACERNGASQEQPLRYDAVETPADLMDPPGAQGSVFEDPDFRLEVNRPRLCESTAPFLPPAGHQRLSVPIEVEARSSRVVPISPMSFTLEDRQGHRYGATLAGCSATLASEELTEGQSLEGEVAFDVPKQAGKLTLSYEPFLIGRKRVLARVEVPSP